MNTSSPTLNSAGHVLRWLAQFVQNLDKKPKHGLAFPYCMKPLGITPEDDRQARYHQPMTTDQPRQAAANRDDIP